MCQYIYQMEKSSTYNQKKPRKLLDQVRDVMRLKHYAISTERTYTSWIKQFIFFHDKKHPKDMGEPEIEAFLTGLAVENTVSKSTQNQAFNVLSFLYREVLNRPLGMESNPLLTVSRHFLYLLNGAP